VIVLVGVLTVLVLAWLLFRAERNRRWRSVAPGSRRCAAG